MKKSLDEAKVIRDEALAMADSLRSEHERQIQVVKEEVEEMWLGLELGKMLRARFLSME